MVFSTSLDLSGLAAFVAIVIRIVSFCYCFYNHIYCCFKRKCLGLLNMRKIAQRKLHQGWKTPMSKFTAGSFKKMLTCSKHQIKTNFFLFIFATKPTVRLIFAALFRETIPTIVGFWVLVVPANWNVCSVQILYFYMTHRLDRIKWIRFWFWLWCKIIDKKVKG